MTAKELERDITYLKNEIDHLNGRIDELTEANKQMLLALTKLIGISNSSADAIDKVVEMVQPMEASLLLRQQMKQKGAGHPRYRADIPTEDIVADYIAHGYKITAEMLEKYPSITYHGLRDRLMKAHVWRVKG